MMRGALVFAILLAAAPLLATEGSGQVEGTIVDEEGTPVPGVLVQLRAGTETVASQRTDGRGRFRFPDAGADSVDGLVAERMGYRTHRRGLGRFVQGITITLQREPVALEGVRVVGEGRLCEEPPEDDRSGRLLWELVRDRYEQGFDTLGIASYVRHAKSRGETPFPALSSPEDLEPRQRGSAPLLRFRWDRQVRDGGYGYRVRRTTASGSYDSWVYPPLEADFSPHFVSRTFGELHDLHLLGTTAGGWRVAFCPRREDDRAVIEGTLTISTDTALVEAEWVFRTPEPVESAGGRAVFDERAGDQRPWPLPREGLFWKKLPDGDHSREYTLFEGWRIAEGDSVPFLPPREEGRDREERRPPR